MRILQDSGPYASMSRFYLSLKRAFDIGLATIGLVAFLPISVMFVLVVKLEDKGPFFYIQERWGKGGRKFKAYKFRTMVDGADQKWGLKPAEENDGRVTNVGKFLRATAMDELPQLINIWKGDMSFVGPRALAVGGLDPNHPQFVGRHQVRPGLTGSAQIYLPRDAALEEKFRYDLDYIKHHTFFGDLKLMLLSIWVTVRGKWESREKKI